MLCFSNICLARGMMVIIYSTQIHELNFKTVVVCFVITGSLFAGPPYHRILMRVYPILYPVIFAAFCDIQVPGYNYILNFILQ